MESRCDTMGIRMRVEGFQDMREVQRRLLILKAIALVVAGLLGLRLWQLQILDGPYYGELSRHNRTRSLVLEPARGLIYDRHGIVLANNLPSFNLYVTREDVQDREALIGKVAELLELDPQGLREKLDMPRRVVKLKEGLTLREAALIESHRLDLPGVTVQPESERNYPVGSYAAHLLGYVGEVSSQQLGRSGSDFLHGGSIVGKAGVEKVYDRIIRGEGGQKVIEVDAIGHEKRTLSVQRPRAGNDLYLTIDFRLQQVAEDLLGEEAGAIVAMDPGTGEILALASRPTFDPNALSGDLTAEEWRAIVQDTSHPLTNRAVQGQYPPGSVFKIIMAAAALDSKAIGPKDREVCPGGFWFGRRFYRDWKSGGHGAVDVTKAIVESCDVFFYKVGHRMGIDTIAWYAEQFGLGRRTGIGLPGERAGIVPSVAWKHRARGQPWYPGETISASIGQGYVSVTPLQMVSLIATLANDGVLVQPHLVQAVRMRESGALQRITVLPRGRVPLAPETLARIKDALAQVVTKGTARSARSSRISIAGKTGTAQVVALRSSSEEEELPKRFRDHAWFVAYAPVDHPRIAVAVLAEHMGHGGSAAAPLATQLIEVFDRLTGPSSDPVPSGISRRQAQVERQP